MRNSIVYIIIAVLAVSCVSARSGGGTGGEVTGVGGTAWAEPTPYGMVLIDRGAIKMGPTTDDSVHNIKADSRGISVDAFWMDQTEITNSK